MKASPSIQKRPCRPFSSDVRGFTGAEKALLIAFALAIIVLLGVLVRQGSDQAAGDARRTLQEHAGGRSALGQVVRPLQAAGDLPSAGDVGRPGQLKRPGEPVAAVQAPPVPPAAPPPPAPAAPAAARFSGPPPPDSVSNFQQLAQFLWGRYDTNEPIGIIRVRNLPNTYVVLLTGTELGNPGQATHIPEDLSSAFRLNDDYRENILRAMRAYGVPQGANVMVVGHSLGGMEAQNIVVDSRFRARYNPIAVVTYGSPITAVNRSGIQYARFSTWGDPVATIASPYSTAHSIARTAAWGGHWILRPFLGENTPVPQQPQEMVGPRSLPSLSQHSLYPNLPDLARYPLYATGREPLQFDTDSFRTYRNPRTTIPTPLGPLRLNRPVTR